jgi:hypothetical protein
MLVAALLVGSLVSCGWGPDRTSSSAPAVDGPVATLSPATGSPVRVEAPVRLAPTVQASPVSPEPLVALATADAARQSGTDPGTVTVVQVEPREWPDRSLGCPRPGMGYAQAITPGFLIVVEVGTRRFEYHTDHAQIVLCDV